MAKQSPGIQKYTQEKLGKAIDEARQLVAQARQSVQQTRDYIPCGQDAHLAEIIAATVPQGALLLQDCMVHLHATAWLPKPRRLADVLLEQQHWTPDQIDAALKTPRKPIKNVLENINLLYAKLGVRLGFITREQLDSALTKILRTETNLVVDRLLLADGLLTPLQDRLIKESIKLRQAEAAKFATATKPPASTTIPTAAAQLSATGAASSK